MAIEPRRMVRKKIKNPNNPGQFIKIPVIEWVEFKDPKTSQQETVHRLNNVTGGGSDAATGRQYHNYTVTKKVGTAAAFIEDPGNTVKVFRIDRFGEVDAKTDKQGFGFRMNNLDQPDSWPAQPGLLNGTILSPLRHVVRYTFDNTLNGKPSIDVELIDRVQVQDPKTNQQETVYRVTRADVGPQIIDAKDPYTPTFAFSDPNLPDSDDPDQADDTILETMLDPFQNIVNVDWGYYFIYAFRDTVAGSTRIIVRDGQGVIKWTCLTSLNPVGFGYPTSCTCTLDGNLNGYIITMDPANSVVAVTQYLYNSDLVTAAVGWQYTIDDGTSEDGILFFSQTMGAASNGDVVASINIYNFTTGIGRGEFYKFNNLGQLLYKLTLSASFITCAVDATSNVYILADGVLTGYNPLGVTLWVLNVGNQFKQVSARGQYLAIGGATNVGLITQTFDPSTQITTPTLKWTKPVPGTDVVDQVAFCVDIDGSGYVSTATIYVDSTTFNPVRRGNEIVFDVTGTVISNVATTPTGVDGAFTEGCASLANGVTAWGEGTNYSFNQVVAGQAVVHTYVLVEHRTHVIGDIFQVTLDWEVVTSVLVNVIGFTFVSFNTGITIRSLFPPPPTVVPCPVGPTFNNGTFLAQYDLTAIGRTP